MPNHPSEAASVSERDRNAVLAEWRLALGDAFECATPGQTLRACTSRQGRGGSSEGATVIQKTGPDASAQSTLTPHAGSLAGANEYTIQELVGEGGMGQIFRADQGSLRRDVAIKKIIPGHLEKDSAQETQESFVSEALVTGVLEHPNIVPVHSLGQDEAGNWFFSMKMVRGIAWKNLLHPNKPRQHENDQPQLDIDDPVRRAANLDENLKILQSVCNAVAFAHSKNVIHRDLKPENVMIGAFGEVLVMDWGLAVDVSPDPNTRDLRMPHKSEAGAGGTAEYMSPEQTYADGKLLGTATDVFLLGAILHELLTGRAPNAGETLHEALMKANACEAPQLPENVPVELAAICRKAQAKEPAKRYASALEFQQSLTDFLKHRESALIAAKAASEAKSEEIPALARAVVLYDQALELWPENEGAAAAVKKARATLALKESRARWTRWSLYGAVASIVIGLAVGFFWIRAARNETEAALKEQRRLAFEAIFRNAEADDVKGESEKIITELSPYLASRELAEHPLRAKAVNLVERARDGFKRFAAFKERVKTREKNVSLDLGGGLMLEMVLIPKGQFVMGGTKYKNETPHEVEITKAFYMGKFAVTQEQYEAVTGTNPSTFKAQKKNPVESVNWHEATDFCNKLNRQGGPAQVAFGLPTEAQWEYACRAGANTEYYFGDDEMELAKHAWFETNAGVKSGNYGTQPVGLKPANLFGLYDMHGNVYQWCQDWYDRNYYKISVRKDPAGPAEGEIDKVIKTEARVHRGGSFGDTAPFCRAAGRHANAPDLRSFIVGFRVVLPLDN